MRQRMRALPILLTLLLLVPAGGGRAETPPAPPGAPPRIVALGDWHGDLEAARRGLRLAGAIDADDRWCGGRTVVVQVGDRLDRGDQEREILDLLQRLGREAAAAGGAVHALIGNHEVMNATGDFRYATDGGWRDFAGADISVDPADSSLLALPAMQRQRAGALRPGGRYARLEAEGEVALVVGRTVFVHGGLLPEHVAYGLDRLNRETRAWLLGDAPEPAILQGRDAPTWVRNYSDEPDSADCALLGQTLLALGCDRMVVGHTIQEGGIAAHCDGRVWCVDTGASAHYGGPVQALEIVGDQVAVLREPEPLVIGDTYLLDSRILGETRRLNVYPPPGYAASDTARYPVLYMPDGGLGEDFLHVAGLVQIGTINGTMRPFLLVGIENTQRRRDLTGPTENPEDRKIAPQVGGSASFRAFIRDELMPLVNRRYRTTGETAIVGESLAGLFVVETFLLEPELFDTYVAIDPSLWWNDAGLVDGAAARLRAEPDLHKTLWLASSDEEGIVDPVTRFVAVLKADAPAGLRWHYEPMPQETHATIYHPAALKAFRQVFAPLQPAPAP